MIDLVLSLDYELFGNDSGDVRAHVVTPANRILDICDRHGAKLTIMFEVAEYWALRQAHDGALLQFDYDPAALMAQQPREAVQRGHDVQLHLHPQWIGAELRDGLWCLAMERYRIADLPNGLGTEDDPLSITGALHRGRQTLENLLKPVRDSHKCRSFRGAATMCSPRRRAWSCVG